MISFPSTWSMCSPKETDEKNQENLTTVHPRLNKENTMGACTCGYSTDAEKNCNGTHNVVKAVKADLIAKLEAEGFPEAADHLKNNK